jgi:hypothetical protein
MKLRGIVIGLLVLVFGFLAISTSGFMKSAVGQANAQCCPTPAPAPTPALSITSVGALAYRATPGNSANTNGVVLVVTDNATGKTSVNFYYQCAPGDDLGKLGKCPSDGFKVFSRTVCTNDTSNTPCSQ